MHRADSLGGPLPIVDVLDPATQNAALANQLPQTFRYDDKRSDDVEVGGDARLRQHAQQTNDLSTFLRTPFVLGSALDVNPCGRPERVSDQRLFGCLRLTIKPA